jgi:hypothetical protein
MWLFWSNIIISITMTVLNMLVKKHLYWAVISLSCLHLHSSPDSLIPFDMTRPVSLQNRNCAQCLLILLPRRKRHNHGNHTELSQCLPHRENSYNSYHGNLPTIKGTNEPLICACVYATWWLNFVWWCLIFVGLQYGTCFISPCWHLDLWGDSYIIGRFVHPCFKVFVELS